MKRTLSIILILTLLLGILPAAVHAGGDVKIIWEDNFNLPNAMRDWIVLDGNADGFGFIKHWEDMSNAYAISPLSLDGSGERGACSDDYLISPPIDLSSADHEYELDFFCRIDQAKDGKPFTFADFMVVDAGDDLSVEALGKRVGRCFDQIVPYPSDGWKKVRCDLTAYRGRKVRLVFRHNDASGNEIMLDDFQLTECERDQYVYRVTATNVPEPELGKRASDLKESDIQIFDSANLSLVPGSLQYLKTVDEQVFPITGEFEAGEEYTVRFQLQVSEYAITQLGTIGSVNGRRTACTLDDKGTVNDDDDTIQVDYYFGYLHAPESCTVTFLNAHGDDPEPQTVPYGGSAAEPKGLTAPDFLFLGWCVDPTCKTPCDFSEPVRGDLILYSKWLYIPGGIKPFADAADPMQYYYAPVYWAVEKGITTGTSDTRFSPNAPCTRAQVVTFLWRAAGKPAPTDKSNPFKDVPEGQYYTDAVLWAVEKGITTGTGPNAFRPDAACTRGQIVTFLWRYEGSPDPLFPKTTFTDVADTEFYAKAVAWAVENDVTKGKSATLFAPGDVCTRAQIVTFLFRATAD